LEEGQSGADRFNYILKIKLGELRSDKEAILNNLEEYFSLVRGSRNTVYTILATIATASIALSQFKGIEPLQVAIVISLIILAVAALVTRAVFHKFILKSTLVAYRIERAYNDCIYLINDLQISNILGNNMKDKEFPPEDYRNRIINALEDASQPLAFFSFILL
jgi:hypothetical protein